MASFGWLLVHREPFALKGYSLGMCVACFTGVEAALVNGAAGTVAARRWVSRLRDPDPNRRRLAVYRQNAEFIASLGQDPVAVLGPPPSADG